MLRVAVDWPVCMRNIYFAHITLIYVEALGAPDGLFLPGPEFTFLRHTWDDYVLPPARAATQEMPMSLFAYDSSTIHELCSLFFAFVCLLDS